MVNFKTAVNNVTITLAVSTFLLLAPMAKANNLPVLGDFSSSIVSLGTEYNLGQGIIRNIRSANLSIDDPIVLSYIQDLTANLVSTSALTDKRISLEVLRSQRINAFAAPGGVLGIHAGIIVAAQAEDELASVISHELAHLSQRHFASQLEQKRINTPLAIASMLTGILIAGANPQAGSAILSSSAGFQRSSQLAFSRRNEQEADRIGMSNLAKAGYDPQAMPRMFNRLLEAQRLQGASVPDFLLTHPSSISRIADAENRANQLTKTNTVPNTLDFSIVKARLMVKFTQSNKVSLNNYRTRAKTEPSALNTFKLALARAQNQKYKQSLSLFKKLPTSWRNHLFVKLSEAEVSRQSGAVDSALNTLYQLDKLYPKHFAIELTLATTLMAAGQPDKAITYLEHITQYAPETVDAWYLLAEAYGLEQHRHKLHTARIQYFLLLGQVKAAKKQIRYARAERSLSQSDAYKLAELEEQVEIVNDFFKTKY